MLRCPRPQVCGVAVPGCRWPGQPRLLRDPPCAKEYEARVDCKCAARLDGEQVCLRWGLRVSGVCVCDACGGIRGVRAASWRSWAMH